LRQRQRLPALGLSPPHDLLKALVAHCVCVGDGDGDGEHALSYLARYLYRGLLSEADILAIDGDLVRFR
jgi:phage tail tape-measure protein